MLPWGNFATMGLRRALFLHCMGLDFHENITLKVQNVDFQPSGGERGSSNSLLAKRGDWGTVRMAIGCMLQER